MEILTLHMEPGMENIPSNGFLLAIVELGRRRSSPSPTLFVDMSWIIWNIRGVNHKESIDHLKILLRQQATSLLVLMEPKVTHAKITRLAFNLGFTYWYHGGESNSLI